MNGQEGPGMEGKEELVSSWQDLRGRSLLTGEHKFEIIAGGRHADVVALDGGMEAFAALSCVKTDDHHAGGFMTVSKGATGSRASEAANPQQKVLHAPESLPDSPKSTNEQVCFDDEEAELLPATKPMQFEGADCVHPTRPQEAVEAVPELEEDNDAEHEASSLAGSDHEYAFIFEKPLSSLAVDIYMQDAPGSGSRRPGLETSLEASRQAALPPTSLSKSQEMIAQGPQPPSPAPPAELAGALQDSAAEGGAVVPNAPGFRMDEDDSAAKKLPAAQDAKPVLDEFAESINSAQAPTEHAAGSVAARATVETAGGNVRGTEGLRDMGGAREPVMASGGLARAWQRSLDEVGVIPGGRAAFGAPAPAQRPQAGAERPAAAAAGIGRAPGGTSVRPLPQLHAQTAARRAAASDARLFPRLVLRRLEARAMPGNMLDCFDRLWHGGSSVVASQS